MKNIKAFKEWSLFAKCVLGYVIIFAVAIIAVCIWEWNALAGYESDNKKAKAESNPDLFFEQYIEEFDIDKYKQIIGDSLPEKDGFYSKESLVEYLAVNFGSGDIKGEKNKEKWTEARPTYDIYAGDEKLLTITLGVKSKNDFGYNVWKEGQIVVHNQVNFDKEVSVIVDNTMNLTVNGVKVTDDYIKESCNTQPVIERINQLTSTEYKVNLYNIKNLLDGYELKVTDASGNELSYMDVNGVRDYTQLTDSADVKDVEDRVSAIVDAYVKIVNKVINRTQMTKYFHKDGPMYEYFGSQQFKDSMYWNFAAKSVTFTVKQVKNIRQISDNVVTCDIYYEADKTYDRNTNVNEDLLHEIISGEVVLVKQDGKWYLDTLKLK